MNKLLICLCLLAVSMTSLATTSDIPVEQESKHLTVERLWEMKRIGSPVASPNGALIVAPVTEFDVAEDKGNTQLWLFDPDNAAPRAITSTGMRASEPVFSPDSKHLAFISKRDDDEAGQIYILPMTSPGEAVRLTNVPTGVSGIKWVGAHLYFISSVWPEKNWEEMQTKLKEEKDKKLSAWQWNALPYASFDRWIDENRQAHVYRIASAGGDVEPVTLPIGMELPRSSAGVDSYDIDVNETRIAFNANGWDNQVDPKIDLFIAEIGAASATNITADNQAPDFSPLFSPDGKTLAYLSRQIEGFYADTARIKLYSLEKSTTSVVNDSWDRSVTNIVWANDGRGFYSRIEDAGTQRLYYINAQNGEVRAITQATDFGTPAILSDRFLVSTNESFLYPARIVKVATKDGSTTRLETFNDDVLAKVEMGTYESVTYKGAEGKDIQMWVHYPPGFDKSKQYPLFLLIHGGPHNAISDGFHYRWNAQTFAAPGYVTAWPNFHGSSSFGQAFADSINPDWKTKPLADVLLAADWFSQQSWIDSERMVAGGASYGGYLASILLGTEHPFKALLIHAAVYNMYSQMAADFAVHSTRFGHYWDNPELYKSISPHYFADKFNTPTLVTHGQLDYRVPVGQGFELFRTLQSKDIPSRMIYFPDENHWIMKPNNSIYWYNEVNEWMASFVTPGAK